MCIYEQLLQKRKWLVLKMEVALFSSLILYYIKFTGFLWPSIMLWNVAYQAQLHLKSIHLPSQLLQDFYLHLRMQEVYGIQLKLLQIRRENFKCRVQRFLWDSGTNQEDLHSVLSDLMESKAPNYNLSLINFTYFKLLRAWKSGKLIFSSLEYRHRPNIPFYVFPCAVHDNGSP